MRTLRLGMSGEDVRAWKNFLIGIDPMCKVVVDDQYDQKTVELTKLFQVRTSVDVDGVVGAKTLGKAMQLGFDPMTDDDVSENGPNWPTVPSDVQPLSSDDVKRLFGEFAFRPAPCSISPEAIVIVDDWTAKNIVAVEVPHLVSLGTKRVNVHRLVAPQLVKLFEAWESAGLLNRVLTWGGCWVPRFVRGSRTNLSNHSWGTAFDVNVQWNTLGARPALKGEKGSVRELVSLANENGFYWGGHYRGRLDGMHFEAFTVL